VYALLHRKSVELDLAFYEDSAYHDTLHRTQQEAPTRPTAVLDALLGLGRSGVTLLGILVLLAAGHWLLPLVLLVAALPGLVARSYFARKTFHWMRERAATDRHTSYLNMVLTSPWLAKEVRVWDLGRELTTQFRRLRTRIRSEGIRIARSRAAADLAAQSAAVIAVFGALAFFINQTLAGAITIGALVMYFQAVQKGQSLVGETLGALSRLYEHNLFLAHLDDFLRLKPTITAPARPQRLAGSLRQGIAFEGVTFTYPAAPGPAVRDVSMQIGAGEMVALVGANGCGKTTLIKLLCRLYDVDSGTISVDGADLRDLDPIELRRRVSVVFQDYATYAATVKENIWYGATDQPLDEDRVRACAVEVGLDAKIRQLPQGYDTPILKIFEGGQDLSGGERQKLALARAFYREADILILDEPSSALDPEAEYALFQEIRRKAHGRAIIVISHRFSTVRMADHIYVMEDGTITEGGSHEALMARGGTYARLFSLQASSFLDPSARPATRFVPAAS
jgi:ATP-binding cassette, subfamily B, bacterial